jgi:serine/threonine protein kinase
VDAWAAISPEQLSGSEGDERADIFASGCVLYELLAGRRAFEGSTALMVLAAIASAEPPPIERISAHPAGCRGEPRPPTTAGRSSTSPRTTP